VRCLDGIRSSKPERVLSRLRRKLHDGAIVMLHDASERGDFMPAAVQAIDAILDSVLEKGFASVTLSELLIADDAMQSAVPNITHRL
jgi:peptidoglycan/xylan/chitin deacetylase (PgdA/CDA1 family)